MNAGQKKTAAFLLREAAKVLRKCASSQPAQGGASRFVVSLPALKEAARGKS